MDALPEIVRYPSYFSPINGEEKDNPLYSARVESEQAITRRNINQESLFEIASFGEFTSLADQVFLTSSILK